MLLWGAGNKNPRTNKKHTLKKRSSSGSRWTMGGFLLYKFSWCYTQERSYITVVFSILSSAYKLSTVCMRCLRSYTQRARDSLSILHICFVVLSCVFILSERIRSNVQSCVARKERIYKKERESNLAWKKRTKKQQQHNGAWNRERAQYSVLFLSLSNERAPTA